MKIVGHRGARGLAPENTIASIEKGLEHHVDMIEFDLRVTRDGVVILHHNASLKDDSGKKLKISEHDFETLLLHKPDLAIFDDAIKKIGKSTSICVEVKRNVDTKPIIKIMQAYIENGWNNFFLGSKSQTILVELHKALPQVPKIVIEPWSGVRAGRRAKELNTQLVSMKQLWLWWGFIKSVSARGWKLYAYTLNDPVKAKRWAKYGLYGVVTDYPDLFEEKPS